nr:Hpt domain-containing protein [Aromatoleum diolicum]
MLQLSFLDQLPDRIRQLEEALAHIDCDDGAAKAARVLVHSLAGAGATFGCPDVSEAARRLETSLFPPGSASAHFDPGSRERIPELLCTLKLAARAARSPRD